MSNGLVVTVFDTETTDLTMPDAAPLDRQPHIIELGFITFGKRIPGFREREINCLIDPGVEITEEITKITGIKPADLKGRDTIDIWLPQIRKTLEESHVVVAHNLAFDKAVIDYEFKRAGEPPLMWPFYQVCTVEDTESLMGHRLNLDALYRYCFKKTPPGKRHRAIEDARFTREIWEHLFGRYI